MILGIDLRERFKSESLWLVDGGRVLVYACLALGLVVGQVLVTSFPAPQVDFVLYVLCAAVVVLLVATVLTPFYGPGLLGQAVAQEAEEMRGQVATVASPAASMSGASGMCAAPAPAHPAADGACAHASTCPHVGTDASLSSSASGVSVPASAPAGASAASGKRAAAPSPDREKAGGEKGRVEAPWRTSCLGIAKLYKLSPRETEILLLIAKGRNAEFVHKELVISLHTAKTHIANIYHKLEVHSSQELISLIETYREQSGR